MATITKLDNSLPQLEFTAEPVPTAATLPAETVKEDEIQSTPTTTKEPNTMASQNPIKRVPKTTGVLEIAQILREDGGIIIEGFLTPEQVHNVNTDVEPTLAALEPCGDLSLAEELKKFQGHQTKRLCNLATLSKTWREEVLDDDLMHGILKEVISKNLGDYWMSSAQLIEIGPGNVQQPLHRDAANWWPFLFMGPGAPILYLNFLIAMTDTNVENGATRYIPGSNKWPYTTEFPNTGLDEWTFPAELNKGDALVINDRIVHGGGANLSEDKLRRVVSLAFVSSVFVPEEASSLFIEKDLVKTMSRRVQHTLGFRTQFPNGSPGLWSYNVQDIGKYLNLPE